MSSEYGLKKDPEIRAAEIEMAARKKSQGFFKNYQTAAELHVEAAELFEKGKKHVEAAENYYEAASVLRLQKPANINYAEIAKYLKKSIIIFRKLLHDDCVKVYEELIEIFTNQIPNAEELARIELEMGDYFVTIQNYAKGVEYLESGKGRNLGENRVSLVEQYLPLAGVYIKEYGMYKKAAQVYKDCIDLYLSNSTTKYAATKVIFSYGLALIAYAVSNKDEPNEVNAQTKKANQGFAADVDIGDLNTKLNDKVFKENDIDRLREGTFLAGIVRALTEGDKEMFFRELGRNVTQLNPDQWQSECLLKIRKFFENEAEASIL